MKFGNFENPNVLEKENSSFEKAKSALDRIIDPAKELVDNQFSKFKQNI